MTSIQQRNAILANNESDEKSVKDYIYRHPSCNKIKTDIIKQPIDVCLDQVRSVLNEHWTSGSEMEALSCAMTTIFFSTAANKNRDATDVLLRLNERINEWFKSIRKISEDTVGGDVYLATVLAPDIDIIVKTVKEKAPDSDLKRSETELLREYFIGANVINRLRYIIPTFMYTLGAFGCPKKTEPLCGDGIPYPYIVVENIPGVSLFELIKSKKLSFQRWLLLFMQVLLSLEVAQRECEFTHYDLHTRNIMVREVDQFSYDVTVGSSVYSITNVSEIPVLIDFGLTSVTLDGKPYGVDERGYERYNILKTMIPGYDMYKLWVTSLMDFEHFNPAVAPDVYRVGQFFGAISPYTGAYGHREAASRFFDLVAGSKLGTQTPLMYANILFGLYSSVLSERIRVKTRTIPYQLQQMSATQVYEDIFCDFGKGVDEAVNVVSKCGGLKASYLLIAYYVFVLKQYNSKNMNSETDVVIQKYEEALDVNAYTLMSNDNALLRNVFRISVPDKTELVSHAQKILALKSIFPTTETTKLIQEWRILTSFLVDVRPYIMLFYTILQLKMEVIYREWMDQFVQSGIYDIAMNKGLVNMFDHVDRICSAIEART